MHLFHLSICWLIFFAISSHASADDSRSARQAFVVRVPPKIKVKTAEIEPQPSIDTSRLPTGQNEPAPVRASIQLSDTSALGMTTMFEVQSGIVGKQIPTVTANLQILSDPNGHWTVDPQPTDQPLQASSTGAGTVTLVISSDSHPEETVIIATIVSHQ